MRRMPEYLLGLDQGSTHSKAVLVDRKGRIVRTASSPLKTSRPRPGWVEHDPRSILDSQLNAASRLLRSVGRKNAIAAVGIANQRSTIILWDKNTGRPLAPAISWQDLRATETVSAWSDHRDLIRSKTGLVFNAHYAAPKLHWMLERSKGLRARAEKGNVLAGTVNSYLIWHLTKGDVHATDPANAARTLLMNLHDLSWDGELLSLFGIPLGILPGIRPCSADYGSARLGGRMISIRASIGDQQSGLLGMGAVGIGEAVVNYGTGGFLLVNTGPQPVFVPGLLASLAWTTTKEKSYATEGTVNSVGTVFDWLVAQGFLKSVSDIDRVVRASRERITLVPALAGVGAPHWLSEARTAILGLGPLTSRADVVRAAVEGVAFLVRDIIEAMRSGGRVRIKRLEASGGGSRIESLVQAQADLSGLMIQRSETTEATARGAALLAGVGCGWWPSPSSVPRPRSGKVFRPRMSEAELNERYAVWNRAIEAVKMFGRES
jgi:glycerol kinase